MNCSMSYYWRLVPFFSSSSSPPRVGHDAYFAPDQTVPAHDLINDLLNSAHGPKSKEFPEGYLIVEDISRNLDIRNARSKRDNPVYKMGFVHSFFGLSNGSLMYEVARGDVRALRTILHEERLPDGFESQFVFPFFSSLSSPCSFPVYLMSGSFITASDNVSDTPWRISTPAVWRSSWACPTTTSCLRTMLRRKTLFTELPTWSTSNTDAITQHALNDDDDSHSFLPSAFSPSLPTSRLVFGVSLNGFVVGGFVLFSLFFSFLVPIICLSVAHLLFLPTSVRVVSWHFTRTHCESIWLIQRVFWCLFTL